MVKYALTYIINHLHVSVPFAKIIRAFYQSNDIVPEYKVVEPYMSFVTYIRYLQLSNTVTLHVAIATQQPDVSAYTGIYQMRCTVYKSCS